MPDPVQRARQFAETAFANMKVTEPLNETALVRDGAYCGHRFMAGKFQAVWFFEENEIKIYDDKGRFLRSELLEPVSTEYRRAA